MIKKYYNILDYVAGTEYYLTSERVEVEYRVNPDNFYVYEEADLESIGLSSDSGNYIVLKLFKKNIDTYTALLDLSRRINIPFENILFLGLKDKYASTTQYVFIKKELVDINELINIPSSRYRIEFYGYVSRKPRRSILRGNRFRIIIREIDEENYSILKNTLSKILEHGLPSYYGYQRFGYKRFNTHLLGKYLVLNRTDLFMHELLHSIYPCEEYESVLKRVECRFDTFVYENIVYKSRDVLKSIKLVNKITHNLYIDAYVSYLFNLLLNNIIDNYNWSSLDNYYPTIGCTEFVDKYYRDILSIEAIPLNKLNLFKCWFRKGLFKPRDLVVNKNNREVSVDFSLDTGFYATIVIRELFKDKLILC